MPGLCCKWMLFSSASTAGSISDKNEWCGTVPKDLELLELSNKSYRCSPHRSALLSLSTGLRLALYIGLALKSTQGPQLAWLEGGTVRCARTVRLVQGHSAVLSAPGKASVAHAVPNPPLPTSCHAPVPVVRSRSHPWPQILHCWERESQEAASHLLWLERMSHSGTKLSLTKSY